MKKFLLNFVKGLIPELVDAAVVVALSKLREDIQKSKFLNDVEKESTLRGADLLAIRVREELEKQLNG
jgi:hypothetical protein